MSEREAREGGRFARALEGIASSSSRRGFLARVGKGMAAVTAGGVVAKMVEPGEADGYHFCGHIFTTDSCPHPMGGSMPRIDRAGFPLDPKSGKPIDNLGRRVNGSRHPRGRPRKRPSGPRRARALAGTADEGLRGGDPPDPQDPDQVDGGWYRCCGGRVRKLVDCCSTSNKRINGDQALQGYCYQGRKVFCVMYFDTNVPC